MPYRSQGFREIRQQIQLFLEETVTDVMVRRTQLYFRDMDQGLGAVDLVADRMAELLGWDSARRTRTSASTGCDVTLMR